MDPVVNSSTLSVLGVGQKRAASFYGGQNMAPFHLPEALGLEGQKARRPRVNDPRPRVKAPRPRVEDPRPRVEGRSLGSNYEA